MMPAASSLRTRSVTAGWLRCTRRPSSAIDRRASACSSARIRVSWGSISTFKVMALRRREFARFQARISVKLVWIAWPGIHTMPGHERSTPPDHELPRLSRRARVAALGPAPRVPRRHVAGLGLDLSRDQVRAAQPAPVLPDGHAVPLRRRAADGVDALARRALAEHAAMAQRR